MHSSQLQNKSLMEANKEFLGRHEGANQIDYIYSHGEITLSDKKMLTFAFNSADSLVHRTAYAEMLYVLDPSKKTEAIKIIEDSANKVVQT